MLRLWEKIAYFSVPLIFIPKTAFSVASKLGKTRQKILFWTTCFPAPFKKPSPSSSFLFQPLSSTFLFYFFVTIFRSALSFLRILLNGKLRWKTDSVQYHFLTWFFVNLKLWFWNIGISLFWKMKWKIYQKREKPYKRSRSRSVLSRKKNSE